VWLDSAASRTIVEGAAQALVALAEQASQHAVVRVDLRPRNLLCPICRQPLVGGLVPGTTVEVDACAVHGTWFDAGELRVVALAFANLPPPLRFSKEDYEELEDSRDADDGFSFEDSRDDNDGLSLEDAGAFAQGVVAFIDGVVKGLRREE
jgi:Zn-finger nucleic acid-binding protein